jgi:DNA-directed RNA polymerase subunit RPC12/RpoP
MANTVVIACTECEKQMKVPEDIIGKKIRCKECGNVFVVKKPKGAPPPSKKQNTEAKKAAAKPLDNKAKNKLLDDEEEDSKDPYQIVIDDEGISRCPNCAKEMESKEAVICLHCGYNTMSRIRQKSEAVYEATGEDKFHWWLPGILCCVGILVAIGLCIFFAMKTRGWMIGGWFYDDEKPEQPFMVRPGCFIFGNIMITLMICLALGKFAYKRLVLYNKPPEKAIVKDLDDDD